MCCPAYVQSIAREQRAGVPGRGTDLANHIVRTYIDHANIRGKSIAVILVDLSAAFDPVVCEIALGWPRYKLQLERERASHQSKHSQQACG